MVYYRVPKKLDGFTVISDDESIQLIANELFTEGEAQHYNINLSKLEKVNYAQHETYWFFGARFSDDKGYSD